MVARIDGAQRRLSSEQDGRAWLAWHIAALPRQRELPELSSMFEQQKRGPQTAAEQEVCLDQLALAWGINPAEIARECE